MPTHLTDAAKKDIEETRYYVSRAEIESLQSQIIQLQSRVTIIEEKLLQKGLTE